MSFVLLLLFLLTPLFSAAAQAQAFNPTSWEWGLPFASLLLSLAVGPLAFPHYWHRHYGKLMVFLSLCFFLPAVVYFGWEITTHHLLHHLLEDYLPFILLVGSLFVVTGGIRLKTQWLGTPQGNCAILAAGMLAASLIGTTGASMLLIRPLILANAWREHTKHIYIFFIFLVANIGGCLTPLGDPPLFLGFLEGVPFFWTLSSMLAPLGIIGGILLILFYRIDHYYYKQESQQPPFADVPTRGIRIEGKRNLFLLGAIIFAVLGSGLWTSSLSLSFLGVSLKLENIVRDVTLFGMMALSLIITNPITRQENHFSWAPFLEIVKIFFGIFVTVIPVLEMLRGGTAGPLGSFIALANPQGVPHNPSYFWLTGLFSSFLDNAPTYLVFFHMAGGEVNLLTTSLAKTLLAISMGAVFMGAMSYIGNAPNFMIKSIAEGHGIKMPHFFGYMGWSCVILLPLFLLIALLFL